MGKKAPKQRLDEILIEQGLITEAQVKETLQRQKTDGGRFGSLLLYYNHIDEIGLVKALEIQLGIEGVVLSDYDVPDILTRMIPKKIAISRKVMPFDYDIENDILKIACEDPGDRNLVNELRFVAHGKEIKLYIAPDAILNCAIAKYYMGLDLSLKDDLLLKLPDVKQATGTIQILDDETVIEKIAPSSREVLIITENDAEASQLESVFALDNYGVTKTTSIDKAIKLLDKTSFRAVFIHLGETEVEPDFIDRIRRISPQTIIHRYQTASSLLIQSEKYSTTSDLLTSNLDLLTSLLSSYAGLPSNHSSRVGRYTDKLCRKLGLPDKDRLVISVAGYVHDLARYYYSTDATEDNRRVIQLTLKIFKSLNYSLEVQTLLGRMYIDLEGKYRQRLPLEVLGGNILTIVDLFCDSLPANERLSLDKFDSIKAKLFEMVGKLFLPDVVEAFVDLILDEILQQNVSEGTGQVMIYSDNQLPSNPLEQRLKNEGLRTITQTSAESFIDLYKRSQPDFIILFLPGKPEQIITFISSLNEEGINFENTPTFLLTESPSIPCLTSLIERGIEDIMATDDNLDLLITKIIRLRDRLQDTEDDDEKENHNSTGASGRLSDLNLIDLINALGPGRKTAKITIYPESTDRSPLIVYLNRGHIHHARYKTKSGQEAIFLGLIWTMGVWKIKSIDEKKLPKANIFDTNESILLEGCHKMDQASRNTAP